MGKTEGYEDGTMKSNTQIQRLVVPATEYVYLQWRQRAAPTGFAQQVLLAILVPSPREGLADFAHQGSPALHYPATEGAPTDTNKSHDLARCDCLKPTLF